MICLSSKTLVLSSKLDLLSSKLIFGELAIIPYRISSKDFTWDLPKRNSAEIDLGYRVRIWDFE